MNNVLGSSAWQMVNSLGGTGVGVLVGAGVGEGGGEGKGATGVGIATAGTTERQPVTRPASNNVMTTT
jgi:hypothetical protein